jgi:tape measure domain-containing protein
MARRDVDLVIKAKDQAASVVDSITKALNKFVEAQRNLDSRADKTETTLTQLGAAIGKLDGALKGFNSGQKLAGELTKVAEKLGQVEAKFAETQREVAQYDKQLKATNQSLEKYTGKLERNLAAQERQKAVVAKAKADQKELTRAYEQAVSAQDKLQRRQQKLPGLIEKASLAAEKASRRFNDLSAQVAGTAKPTAALRDRLASAERSMTTTGSRLSKLRSEFGQIGSKINAAGAAITLFGGQASRAGQNLSKQESILANMAESYNRIKAQTQAVGQQQARLSSNLNRTTGQLSRLGKELEDGRAGLDKMSVSTAQATADLDRLAKRGFLSLVAAAHDQKRVVLETSQAYDQARARATALGKALAQTTKPTRDMVQEFQKAAGESTRLKTQLGEQRIALQGMSQTLRNTDRSYEGLRTAQAAFLAIIDRQIGAMNRADASTRKSSASVQALASSVNIAATGSTKLVSGQERLGRASERAAVSTGRLADAYRRFYGDSRRSLSLLQRIRGEVLSLVAAYGGLYGAITALRTTVDATQKLEAAQARLNVAFNNDSSRVAAEFDFIRRTSDRLGVSIGNLATEYSKFSIATKNTSIEGARAKKIFLQIAEAARVNRSSTEELQGVFVALTQIVSKGAVQMEELRQQLGDRLPGAIQIMADGLGVTTAELIKMMEQGQVTEEALVGFADEVSKRFGGGLESALLGITVALGRLENAAFQAAAQFGEGGFIAALTGFANTLTEVLKSADFEAFTRRASKALGGLLDFLGFLASNFEVVVTLLVSLLAYKLVPIVLFLGKTFNKATKAALLTGNSFGVVQARAAAMGVSITRTGYAIRGLTRAMRGLVGSTGVGLAFIAVSAALAAWSTDADRATVALNTHRKIVDDVKNAYEAAGGASEDWADTIEGVTRQQAQVSLANIRTELNRARVDATAFVRALGDAYEPLIGGSEETQESLRKLARRFQNGEIKVQEYKDALEALAIADPDLDINFVADLQDSADGARELETAFDEASLAVQVLGDNAEDAQDAVEALVGAMDPDTADKMQEAMDKLGSAMDALEDSLPKSKDGMDEVAQAAEDVATAYQDALKAARSLPETIQRIAAEQGVLNAFAERFKNLMSGALDFALDNTLVDRIIGVESGGNPSARNPESSATGLGQFVTRTWLELFKKHFPDRAAGMTDAMILALREDAAISRDMVGLYLRENAKILQRMGVQLTDANLYLAHFLGPGGATALLRSAPGTKANDVLGSDQIAANQGILDGKTREEILAWAQRKVGISSTELDILEDMVETERDRAEATSDRIADNEFEISQQQMILDGKAREAAIEEAIRDARKDDPGISEENIAKIREQTGALFDLELAQNRAKDADKDASAAARDASARVNALLAQQKALYDQLAIAKRDGDTGTQEELRQKLANVNTELEEAIANARAMWEAIGGADAENALIKLDTAALKAGNLAAGAQKVYLDWSRVGDLFVTGLASAFDSFARKVAEGANVFDTARDAFLQFAADFLLQIAQMIIQQAILNALQAAFGGTSFGSLIGVGHTGGMVGSSRVGSGNSSRQVNPAIFASAMRYHVGGVVGLRPGEVPIVAKEGEEMLTRDDPRHMLNGGLSGGSGAPAVNVRNINTFDAPGFLQAALDTPVGEKVLFNFISANPGKFRAAMGA